MTRLTWLAGSIHVLPEGATHDAALLLRARAVRAFGDGFVSVLLPVYLTTLGFGAVKIGAITTATLAGSAVLTLLVGFVAYRLPRRKLLLRVSALMVVTGLAFAFVHEFWPLVVIAFIGTMNPSSGDVSVFLPTEQALMAHTVVASQRTALYARYSLVGALVAAVGSLAAGLPDFLVNHTSWSSTNALGGMFVVYALLGLVAARYYGALSPSIETVAAPTGKPLEASRGIVYRLAALFSLDSFGGGFVVQSLLALWLFERFDLSVATAGTIFFWTGICNAFSQLAAPRLAARIGLIQTMVYTHLPANCFLILAALMPSLPLAVTLLLVRSLLSSMDVPARTSYVMAVVTPEERPAAASVTNVPRSLAAAASPMFSGYLLGLSTFGWPLVIGGTLKGIYDLLLLSMFRRVKPPEEHDALPGTLHHLPSNQARSTSQSTLGASLHSQGDN
ncbi:MAG: MFS transporter [Thermomicrobiales bacterium]